MKIKEKYVTIKLPKGGEFITNEDLEKTMNDHRWYKNQNGHISSLIEKGLYASDLVVKNPDTRKFRRIFIDRNPLNITRENIIVVEWSQMSVFGRKTSKKSTSKYKGVSWDKNRKKWIASLSKREKGKRVRLLYKPFNSEDEAARAYNKAALLNFGQYAYQNDV